MHYSIRHLLCCTWLLLAVSCGLGAYIPSAENVLNKIEQALEEGQYPFFTAQEQEQLAEACQNLHPLNEQIAQEVLAFSKALDDLERCNDLTDIVAHLGDLIPNLLLPIEYYVDCKKIQPIILWLQKNSMKNWAQRLSVVTKDLEEVQKRDREVDIRIVQPREKTSEELRLQLQDLVNELLKSIEKDPKNSLKINQYMSEKAQRQFLADLYKCYQEYKSTFQQKKISIP